ncbi:MAG TPA: hypothetical protein VGK74_29085 [Symbiobacteriaceae bacterium]|jgi:hypothetical protein
MRRLIAAVVLLGALLLPAVALADPWVPDRPPGAPAYAANKAPLYDSQWIEPWAYTFEGDGQYNSIGLVTVYFWMNELLVAKAWVLKSGLRLVEYALTSSFFDPLADKAAGALSAFGDTLWSADGAPLIAGALSLSALWAMLLYVRGRVTRVWSTLGGTVLVLMAATVVLTAGADWAKPVVNLSRQMSTQVYGSIDKAGKGKDTQWPLLARSGDAAWRTLVYEPWVTGEFGSEAGEKRYGTLEGEMFLIWTVEARQTVCLGMNERVYCPYWQNSFLPKRMLLAIWTALATALYAGALVVLASSVILAQLSLLFFLALAPVWLLVALWWPGRGMQLLNRFLTRVLGVLVSQVMLAATLGVLLFLSETLGDAFPKGGWMFRSILLAALGGLAVKYRYAWLMPFTLVNEQREQGRLLPWLRPRRGESPAEGTAVPAPTELIPAFGAILATAVPVPEPALPGIRPGSERDQPGRVPREVFRSQMEVLRERWRILEQGDLQVEPAVAGELRPGERSLLPSAAEPVQNGGAPQMGQPRREHSSDMSRLPNPRPRA